MVGLGPASRDVSYRAPARRGQGPRRGPRSPRVSCALRTGRHCLSLATTALVLVVEVSPPLHTWLLEVFSGCVLRNSAVSQTWLWSGAWSALTARGVSPWASPPCLADGWRPSPLCSEARSGRREIQIFSSCKKNRFQVD